MQCEKNKCDFAQSFQSNVRNPDPLRHLFQRKLYNRPRGETKRKTLKNLASTARLLLLQADRRAGPRAVLPPLHCGPAAFAAAACLAGAFGAGEELGHELGDVWKLGVGVQHVHGLLHFL